MKPDWKSFLENRGAELEDERVVSFGNPEQELRVVTTGKVLADLSHVGLLAVTGPDAATFLQGQLTNDIRMVSETRSQMSAYCSPKGRMLANFRIFKRGEAIYLAMPRENLEAVLKRLRMFVLAAKVHMEDANGSLVRIGFAGPSAESELRDYLGVAPAEVDETAQVDGLTVIRLPGSNPRFEIYGERETVERAWIALDVRAAPVGTAPWNLLDILAGVPVIYPETADAFVPQMANLQLIGGVSFKKGCYTGQEIVARMQYLGKLKRRMYRASVSAEQAPIPGQMLFASDSTSGQGAGRVVNAAPSPEGGHELLVVVEIASREAGAVHLGDPDGPILQFQDLPYPLPPVESTDQA